VQVPEESAWRLAGRSEVPDAPLAPLLGAGSLALRVTGAPALFWESPPYLSLRDLCRSASALVAAWEGGDRTFALRFGNAELQCDLTRDEVRASGFPDAVTAPAPALALALAGAARRYAIRALALAQDAEELSDLREAARRIEEHCKDLSSGDLRRGRPAIAAAPAPRAQQPRHEPLSRGRVRRLVYREAWRTAPAEPADALTFCGNTVLASVPHGMRALDLASGRELFHSGCDTFARAANADDLFVASRSTLSRVDPATGDRRWQRRMPGSLPALWPVPGGVLRPTQTGIACISDFGEVAFETRLAFTPELCAAGDGVLLLGSRDVVVAVDGAGGVLLWRRKTPWGALAVALASGRALVLCADRRGGARLLAFGQRTGKPLWERPLPGHPEACIRIAYECAIVSTAEKVIAARLADGTLRFEKAVPFPGDLRLSCAEDEDSKWTLLVATGQGGACARIGERGKIAWSLPGEGTTTPQRALLSRGVALVMRGGALLLDGQEGLPLARIGDRPARCAALAPDASVALCDDSGSVSLQKLASHLSVVTT
jgi:hypothetical protein